MEVEGQGAKRGTRMSSDAPNTLESRTLKTLWRAVFWVSFPFGILSCVLPIYGKELGATALEVGGLFSAMSFYLNTAVLLAGALLVGVVLRESRR